MKKTILSLVGAIFAFGIFALVQTNTAQADKIISKTVDGYSVEITYQKPDGAKYVEIMHPIMNATFVLPSKDITFYSEVKSQKVNTAFKSAVSEWNIKMRISDPEYNLHFVNNESDALVVLQDTDLVSDYQDGLTLEYPDNEGNLSRANITLTHDIKAGNSKELTETLTHEVGHSLGHLDQY